MGSSEQFGSIPDLSSSMKALTPHLIFSHPSTMLSLRPTGEADQVHHLHLDIQDLGSSSPSLDPYISHIWCGRSYVFLLINA